jgi:hypothetical protein
MLGYIKDRAIRNGTDPARLRLLEFMRFLQLILFPMLGFFAGPDIVARWNE